ncbi:MAG TPA: alanine racemase [Nevskiaceae bacterium]
MNAEATVARVTACIDLDALRHNLARMRACAPAARVIGAVKANAYGHGAIPVARSLADAGIDALAVACLEEALALREAQIAVPVVLLEGVLSAAEARLAVDEKLQIVVHADWQLELLEREIGDAPAMLWVMLNTGMNRLGFAPDAARRVAKAIADRGAWRCCGWMTHLACADEVAARTTLDQQARFEAATAGLPGARSMANSAGLIAWPKTRTGWVRPGIMLYGASPFADRSAAELGLRPVMRLESRLIAIQSVGPGEHVGYGATWAAERATRIGIVAAGYADGIPRTLPSGTPVAVRGHRVPTAGRVSMDMFAVDLGDLADAEVGDAVRVWGEGVPAEAMAASIGSIAYELFCRLGPRVRRVYLDQRAERRENES